MGAPEKSQTANNSMQRVKVYRLNDDGKWDDQGTGHVTVDYMERAEELSLFVIDEGDNETLLSHRISSDDIYRKQDETIISWRDPEYSTELALSFQETTWCSYIWDHICNVQRNLQFSTLNRIKVRAYCPVGKSDQGRLALDVAVKALDIYKKYFSMPYTLPKLDMVAVLDFQYGAMENYGLITYRESELLYDNLYSTAVNKQRLAIVVTHEVAHQWFGNLVTMEWWTHLWLNEGFATWVSYLVTDTLFPEWEIWTKFLEDTAGGLHLDALETSHPIEVEIHHARSIDEVADDI